MLRVARASTNAPSSAQNRAMASSRASASLAPAPANRAAPAAIQRSNTSAHASRMTSLALETSSATVAIGHASA